MKKFEKVCSSAIYIFKFFDSNMCPIVQIQTEPDTYICIYIQSRAGSVYFLVSYEEKSQENFALIHQTGFYHEYSLDTSRKCIV